MMEGIYKQRTGKTGYKSTESGCKRGSYSYF